MKKICSTCKLEKPQSEFGAYQWKNKKRPTCSSCKSNYNKNWYDANKAKHKADARRNTLTYIERNVELLAKLKNLPCKDCGGSFPAVCMDFDHLDAKTKYKCVARLKAHSVQTLLDEINKCELVCANCHRIRTHKRLVEAKANKQLDPNE